MIDKYEIRRQRLMQLRDGPLCGGRAAELARRIGKEASYVSRMLYPDGKAGKKRIGDEMVEAIENGFNLPRGWLDGIEAPAQQEQQPVNLANANATLIHGQVPLISWVQAGTWQQAADPYALGDAEAWLPCPVKHGGRTLALRVRGESMHNPDGKPSYSDGDIIFVDPDRTAQPGDRVVVRLDDRDEATFKQLVVEDGRKLLKALNPDWSPRYIEINGNATLVGVVIGKWVPE